MVHVATIPRASVVWPVAVFALAAALCLPFIRTVWWFGDEGILLSGAMRLLHGRGLYTETWGFLPPGSYLITAAWLSMFGPSFASARCLVTASVAGTACLTFLLCHRLARSRLLAAAVSLAWVLMMQGFGFQLTHHYFTIFLSMLAAWLSLSACDNPRTGWRAGVAGYFCAGVATMITPNRGVLLALSLVATLYSPGKRALWMPGAAFVAAPLAMLAYLACQHALSAAYSDIVAFTAVRYSSVQWVPFASAATPQNMPLAVVFPAAVAAAILAVLRRRAALLRDHRYQFCIALAAAGLIGAFPRPDIVHLGFAAPLALPLLCYGLAIFADEAKPQRLVAAALVTIFLARPAVQTYFDLLADGRNRITAHTAAGDIRLPPNDRFYADLISELVAAPKAERVFFYPYLMLMPYLTGREQVGRNDVFIPGYTEASQYKESCLEMLRSADWIVIDETWVRTGFLRTVFPAMGNADPPEKQALERSIPAYFTAVRQGEGLSVWRRKSVAGSSPNAAAAEEWSPDRCGGAGF